jgi:putative phosphoesterase
MRVAVISDIHSNLPALLAVGGVLREADAVICLGDLLGYYCQVNEVLDFIRTLDATCILGNHDYFVLAGCPESTPEAVQFGVAYADRTISSDHRAWLAKLPLTWAGLLAGKSILAVHGSPWRPLTDYLYPSSGRLAALREFDFDLIAFGQTHRSLSDHTKRPWLLNPGSIGQSRNNSGQAGLAVWDTDRNTIDLIERSYDPAPVIELALKNGAGTWITKHLQKDGAD